MALRTSENNETPFKPGQSDVFTFSQKNTGRVSI
jgi:hypothetical protein